ncbi:ABC transporter substrate-binding protein [Phyllobacterium phragmitis]|uniref:ABC transporter substrate-binding protein n=1 Tax=Phyllobacterium phragmitis TaxID=2670329 RepID=UPI00130497C1|nr:ABC transporter substrate-binding protein [Phyllobacterium phragmitis]
MTIAVQKVPDFLDPVLDNSNVNERIMWSLFNTLVTTDYRDGGKLKPGLATEWKILDAQTIEFKLRPGVKFHNGDDFNAKDVVFSFSPERTGQEKNGAKPVLSMPFLGGIDKVDVIDPLTVRIHMRTPDALIVQRFANYPAQILSRKGFEDAGSMEAYSKRPIGTGPYKLSDFNLGERVILQSFAGYWGEEKAAAGKVTFTVVPEASTRIAGLLSGQFDIVTELNPDNFQQIESSSNAAIVGGAVENIRGVVYDSTGSILSDPRIREALDLSIDREAIVKSLYNGKTEMPNGWQMKTFGAMYLADRPAPEFNPGKARELLKAAGYKGERISYRTMNAYYTNEIETAQILQGMWSAVGLNVQLDVKETWDQINEDTPDRAIFNASFTAYYPDPMGQFWRRFGTSSNWAASKIFVVDPEQASLGETLATSMDTDERRKVFAEMLDRFNSNPHGSALHLLTQFFGVNKTRLTLDTMPTNYLDLTTAGVQFK